MTINKWPDYYRINRSELKKTEAFVLDFVFKILAFCFPQPKLMQVELDIYKEEVGTDYLKMYPLRKIADHAKFWF